MADPLPASPDNQDHMQDEDEDEEEDDEEEEEEEAEFNSGDETGHNNNQITSSTPEASGMGATLIEPSELMQLDMSEDIRVGSPNDGSNNLDSNFHMLAVTESDNPLGQADSYRIDLTRKWDPIQDPLDSSLQVQQPPDSVLPPIEDHLTQEDTHYSQTVSSILQSQSTRWAESSPSSIACYITCSTQSAFAKWTSRATAGHYHHAADGSSQWLLKYILFTVPYLHSNKGREENNSTPNNTNSTSQTDRVRGGKGGGATAQDELSANHVLAERRRREKLNERFIILRSLVPFVTKMDKASILGDTIEYVKQLRRKIQDLEARNRQMETEQHQKQQQQQQQQQQNSRVTTMDLHNNNNNVQRTTSNNNSGSSTKEQSGGVVVVVGQDKRKVRILEGNKKSSVSVETSVQVSIIESDALLELECDHREGLLLDVMMVLREMRIEVIGVQSSLNNGIFMAELRAKVKENCSNGKKVSIAEVKRALNQVIPHTSD